MGPNRFLVVVLTGVAESSDVLTGVVEYFVILSGVVESMHSMVKEIVR